MGATLSKPKRGTRNTARSKLTQDFIERLAGDFKIYGQEVIEKLREESPAKYAEVISKLVPQEMLVHHDESADLAEMSLQTWEAYTAPVQKGSIEPASARMACDEGGRNLPPNPHSS
jgi:hypothetical protein